MVPDHLPGNLTWGKFIGFTCSTLLRKILDTGDQLVPWLSGQNIARLVTMDLQIQKHNASIIGKSQKYSTVYIYNIYIEQLLSFLSILDSCAPLPFQTMVGKEFHPGSSSCGGTSPCDGCASGAPGSSPATAGGETS